jgi:hypothetical protein
MLPAGAQLAHTPRFAGTFQASSVKEAEGLARFFAAPERVSPGERALSPS